MFLPSLVLALGNASDLTGAWELRQAGSDVQGPWGIYYPVPLRPHPRLWASGLSRVFFFVFFAESKVWPGPSGKLFTVPPEHTEVAGKFLSQQKAERKRVLFLEDRSFQF